MSSELNTLYDFEGFRIDLTEQTLWYENERIPLAPRVLETLIVLIENSDRLMTKDELMDKIWGETFVEERNLTQNIFTLRKEFKKRRKEIKFIETVPRRGYRFVAELHPVEIEREEVLAVQHRKQMHITAEGSVSKQELTEAVKEITKDLVSSKPKPQTTKIRSAEQNTLKNAKGKWFLITALLSLLFVGAVFVAWQNNFLNFRKPAFANDLGVSRIEFTRLTDSGNSFFPVISPDKQFGAYIINQAGKFRIVLKHLATQSITEVVSPQENELRSLNFSKDGNYLFYASSEKKNKGNTIYQIPIFGGNPRKITDGIAQNFTISPDEKHFAFYRHDFENKQNHLIICKIDGSEQKILATMKDGKNFSVWGGFPAWSPDGNKIAVVIRDTNYKKNNNPEMYLAEVNATDGTVKKIKTPDWDMTMQAFWLSDGSGLVVMALDKPDKFFKLYHLSYPDGEARLITNDTNNYTEFRLSADTKTIIAAEEKSPYNLQLISAENPTEIRSLTDSAATRYGIKGLEWTPDGRSLIYTKFEGNSAANIWKMDVETQQETQLTFEKGVKIRFPKITPDGKTIIFASNRTGNWHIWRMNSDGSNQKQITDGKDGENNPQISTDGKWLLYTTPAVVPNTLWKIPLEGGTPTVLLENGVGVSEFSPDMKTVITHYFDTNEKEESPWKFVSIPFDSGQEILDLGFNSQHHVIDWKPDGSGIYYLTRGQSHTDIWFCSYPSLEKNVVTDLKKNLIINARISPDGKTFAVARGKVSSNLYLIENFR